MQEMLKVDAMKSVYKPAPETIIKIDLTKSAYENDMIHNRWHPDIPMVAWVEPGVLNLDLSRAVAHLGLHFAPDPSSQQSCSVGGDLANNSGGPHCLLYGVTSAHVLAVEVVLPDGELVQLGGKALDAPGAELIGAFVGSEGTLGIATKITLRVLRAPEAVRTMLACPQAEAGTSSAASAARNAVRVISLQHW